MSLNWLQSRPYVAWPTTVFVLTVVLLGVLGPVLQRLDLQLYDYLLSYRERPVTDQVVIVAIDEKSLEELGRWPWSRATHAQALSHLTDMGVKAVGIDLLFVEPANDGGDELLAEQIARNGRVVLALAPRLDSAGEISGELGAMPSFSEVAAASGHVDVELDVDGICRQVFVKAGYGMARWSALGSAVVTVATGVNTPRPGEMPSGNLNWVRDLPVLIDYQGAAGSIPTVPFSDLYHNRVPEELLEGKIVLIGATAAGLGDYLAVPFGGNSRMMAGVEVNANLALTMLNRQPLQRMSAAGTLTLFTLLLIIQLLLLRYGQPPLSAIGSLAATGMVTALMLKNSGFWFAPSHLLLVQIVLIAGWYWRDHHRVLQWSAVVLDKLRRRELQDPVTGLPNLIALEGILENQTDDHLTALCCLAPGNIGLVNRQYSRLVGDHTLSAVAEMIQRQLGEGEKLFIGSGSEFMITVTDKEQPAYRAEYLGGLLLKRLSVPLVIDDCEVRLHPAVGIALVTESAQKASLVSDAFVAMDRARQDVRCRLAFYQQKIRQQIEQDLAIQEALRDAIANDSLSIFYQPQVSTDDGELAGVEALLRWQYQGEMVSPERFIPLAEESGLILELGEWVLRKACHQAAIWLYDHRVQVRMAVNVSGVQFHDPDFYPMVRRVLEETQLPGYLLELEITETALIGDMAATITVLHELKALGITLAVDDFGTGHSAFSYLREFPIDRLKIDRSFVSNISECSSSAEITAAIIDMAHKLRLTVIAEGVESEQQRDLLSLQACEELQGYHFGKPCPAEEVEQLFKVLQRKI